MQYYAIIRAQLKAVAPTITTVDDALLTIVIGTSLLADS
jgi:hypothetical protein